MRPTHCLPERSEGKTKVIKQQYLPFTVLKLAHSAMDFIAPFRIGCNNTYRLRYAPQSVRQQRSEVTMRPIHCLPERREGKTKMMKHQYLPFTVLKHCCCNSLSDVVVDILQQYLPLAVLKLTNILIPLFRDIGLQQYLSFTVLKHEETFLFIFICIKLQQHLPLAVLKPFYISDA